jgi:hypothetical protein
MAEVMVISYQGKHVVWPPYVVVAPGEEVVFKAVGVDATVFLPMPEMFEDTVDVHDGTTRSTEPAQKTDKGLVLEVGKQHTAVRVKKTDGLDAYPVRAAYPYSVYCKQANTFAEGNSAPVMIIEPPPGGDQPAPRRTTAPGAKVIG